MLLSADVLPLESAPHVSWPRYGSIRLDVKLISVSEVPSGDSW